MLSVEELHAHYGPSHVLRGLSMDVLSGTVTCVLGRNGVGKSTLVRSIMGMMSPSAGSITFSGEDITRAIPHGRARMGMAVVPQGRRVFGSLTVSENLRVAGKWGKFSASTRPEEEIYDWFPNLAARRDVKASVLSGGEQQMLAVGRALMARPRLVIMDEPSEGLSPALVGELGNRILALREEGVAVLLVEQSVRFALGVSSHAYLMARGRVLHEDTAEALLRSPELLSKHLGTV